MTEQYKGVNQRKADCECRITDVSRDSEAVYVHFGKFGQASCFPVEDCETTKAIIHTDTLEPSDTIRVVDTVREWTLRGLDDYFYERIGMPVHELIHENERLAENLGQWFITHFDWIGYDEKSKESDSDE